MIKLGICLRHCDFAFCREFQIHKDMVRQSNCLRGIYRLVKIFTIFRQENLIISQGPLVVAYSCIADPTLSQEESATEGGEGGDKDREACWCTDTLAMRREFPQKLFSVHIYYLYLTDSDILLFIQICYSKFEAGWYFISQYSGVCTILLQMHCNIFNSEGQGDPSVSKVPSFHIGPMGFFLSLKEGNIVANACGPYSGEVETGKCLGFDGQPTQPSW